MLKGIIDDECKLLDDFEDVEYDRKVVEVVFMVNNVWFRIINFVFIC